MTTGVFLWDNYNLPLALDLLDNTAMSLQTSRKGFTLIELLVVIAIIGILASMLLPALAKAKTKTQSIKCTSNLSQMVKALHMYSHDDKAGFHPAYGGVNWNNNFWFHKIVRYCSDDHKILFCPRCVNGTTVRWGGSQDSWGGWNDDKRINGGNPIPGSYTFNGWNHHDGGSFEQRMQDPSDGIPTDHPAFSDGNWVDTWCLPTDAPPPTLNGANNSGMARVVVNRHEGKINVVFNDGHTGVVEHQKLWTLRWHKLWANPTPLPTLPIQ